MKNWLAKLLVVLTPMLLAAGIVWAASAPFDPDQTKPSDTDVVSQYPAIERTFRDIIESWLVVDHDKTIGGHDQLTLIDQTTDPTFPSGVVGVWNNAGVLSTRVASGTVSAIAFALPAGTIVDYAGTSAPTGWLLARGQCVSRTTYADLFTAISTTYDDGCSGSDFGIPDTRGRVSAGEDDMGGTSANRLTGLSGGLNGDLLGATGGAETHTLTTAELAVHTHVLTDPGHEHPNGGGTTKGDGGNPSSVRKNSGTGTVGEVAVTDITIANTGSGNAHNNVQPVIILMKIIKT